MSVPPVRPQSELADATTARQAAESALTDLRDTFGKLEATAAKLRSTQEATARELVEQQVGGRTG
jgi:DNA recombination-dependent growth factor C